MKLNNLKPAKGSTKNRKRIARGVGAGSGRTATRGHNGAKSRSGWSNKREFQGGQMPLQKLMPKRGFKNTHRRYQSERPDAYVAFNLSQLEYFAGKHHLTEITPAILADLSIVSASKSYKVLANGELKQALEVTAQRFSASAKKAIIAAGGKAFVEIKLSSIQGIAHTEKVEKVDMALVCKHMSTVAEGDAIHIIVDGTISQKLTIEAHKISDAAKAQVEALGGTVTLV